MLDRMLTHDGPLATKLLPSDDRNGREVLVAIMKLSLDISERGDMRLAKPRSPIRLVAEPMDGHPGRSIRYPSDAVDHKPGTELLLVGTALPPPDQRVDRSAVTVTVRGKHTRLHKQVMVFGPRVWMMEMGRVVPGPPAAMGPTPLAYEHAYGGRADDDPSVVDKRNPCGLGVALDARRLVGKPTPRIEHPAAPFAAPRPSPAGFGPLAAHWSPRAERFGTCDDLWRRRRAPIRPLDFDPRHAISAPDDQWSAQPFKGDEQVEVVGATPSGRWRFELPGFAPVMLSKCRGTASQLVPHLDTMLLDADALRVELSWRVSLPRPRRLGWLEYLQVAAVDDHELRAALGRTALAGWVQH